MQSGFGFSALAHHERRFTDHRRHGILVWEIEQSAQVFVKCICAQQAH